MEAKDGRGDAAFRENDPWALLFLLCSVPVKAATAVLSVKHIGGPEWSACSCRLLDFCLWYVPCHKCPPPFFFLNPLTGPTPVDCLSPISFLYRAKIVLSVWKYLPSPLPGSFHLPWGLWGHIHPSGPSQSFPAVLVEQPPPSHIYKPCELSGPCCLSHSGPPKPALNTWVSMTICPADGDRKW